MAVFLVARIKQSESCQEGPTSVIPPSLPHHLLARDHGKGRQQPGSGMSAQPGSAWHLAAETSSRCLPLNETGHL